MRTLRASVIAVSPQGWRGVLRNAYGEIVWSCDHIHQHRNTQSPDSARCCACAEQRKRDAPRARKRAPPAG